MARAYQCDVCKKCFPIKDRKIGQAYHVSIEDFMKDRSPEFSFEVCPDCLKKMKNKIENMEEN